MRYWKFVKWDTVPFDDVLKKEVPQAIQAWENGDKKPFNDLKIATTNPFFKYGGWCIALYPYLKKYWVKTKYYGILEYYAVNKTAIRNELKSSVIKIVEVKQ